MDKRFDEVANYWGNQMPMMAMEECGELIQAISKYERKTDDEHRENLLKELADIYISVEALKRHYNISDLEVSEYIEKKVNKTYA